MATLLTTHPLRDTSRRPVLASPPSNRIPELDGLRGIAIGMVVLYHAFFFNFAPNSGSAFAYLIFPIRIGWSGVDLFFVLSGFLIGGILLDSKDSSNYFQTFYTRRFLRIVPVYYATLLCLFALSTWSKLHSGVSPAWIVENNVPWALFVLFLHNFWMAASNSMGSGHLAVFWSLAVEEQFYLTLPWLVRYFDRKRIMTLAIEAILLAPALRIVCYSFWPNHSLSWFVLMPCRADALFFGVLGAAAVRDPVCKAWIGNHKNTLRALIVFFALGVPFVTQTNLRANGLPMVSVMLSWLAAFYLLVLVYAFSFPASLPSRCLRWSWLRWLGMIAYGMYLFHELVLTFARNFFGVASPSSSVARQLAVSGVAVAVTFLLASLSWLYFEKPLVQRGHRLRYESPKLPPITATPD
jgi:peptidoglycan/LPS O-acetylase OafA/YrhL